jgi:salicylate hydroxylase/6-hydroxynicotinate 3-monooxygenase
VQTGSSANTWMRNETNPDWLYGYDAWTTPLSAPVAAQGERYLPASQAS